MASSTTEVFQQYSNPRSRHSQAEKPHFEPWPRVPQRSWTQSDSYFPPPHSYNFPRNTTPEVEQPSKDVKQHVVSPALSCLDDLPQLRLWSQDDDEAHVVEIPTPTETAPAQKQQHRPASPRSRSRSKSKSRSRSREPLQLYAPTPPPVLSSGPNLLAGSGAVAVPIRPSPRPSTSSSWAESAILSRERVSSPIGRAHSASHVEPSSGWPTAKDSRRTQSASHIDPGSGWPVPERDEGMKRARVRARSPMAPRENDGGTTTPTPSIHRPVPQVAGAGVPPPPALLHPERVGNGNVEKKRPPHERARSKSPRPHTPYPLPIPTVPNDQSSPLLTLPDGLRIRLPTAELQLTNGALVIPTPHPAPAAAVPQKREPVVAVPDSEPTASCLRRPSVPSAHPIESSLLFGGEFAPGSLPAQGAMTPERKLSLAPQTLSAGRPVLGNARGRSSIPDISTSVTRYPCL